MCVVDTLAGQVTKVLEEQLFTLVGVAQIALRCRHGIQNAMEASLGAIWVARLEHVEAHSNVSSIAAIRTTKAGAVIIVIVV